MLQIGPRRLEQFRSWLSGNVAAAQVSAADIVPDRIVRPAQQPTNTPLQRLAALEALWGVACPITGGAPELVRLASPLGLSGLHSVLLVGGGGLGPAEILAGHYGAWVAGHECSSALHALASRRAVKATGLSLRASVETWDPAAPVFRAGFYHRALLWETLAQADPAALCDAVAGALRPDGQVIWMEMVAGRRADDELLARWRRVEGREADLPEEAQLVGALRGAGFDIRVVEDMSSRQEKLSIAAWRSLLHRLGQSRPAPALAAAVVAEAERWLLRLRLQHQGRLRLVRIYAIR